MSLAEVLDGLHWEAECGSDTTGMGPLWVTGVDERPPWAVLYLARANDVWEIGLAQDFMANMAILPRAPILSISGLGLLVDFPADPKSIWFADAVPEALKRYMKRLERPDPTSVQVREATRVTAWERLTEAGRTRSEG